MRIKPPRRRAAKRQPQDSKESATERPKPRQLRERPSSYSPWERSCCSAQEHSNEKAPKRKAPPYGGAFHASGKEINMGLEVSHDAWTGSYGAFSSWRAAPRRNGRLRSNRGSGRKRAHQPQRTDGRPIRSSRLADHPGPGWTANGTAKSRPTPSWFCCCTPTIPDISIPDRPCPWPKGWSSFSPSWPDSPKTPKTKWDWKRPPGCSRKDSAGPPGTGKAWYFTDAAQQPSSIRNNETGTRLRTPPADPQDEPQGGRK